MNDEPIIQEIVDFLKDTNDFYDIYTAGEEEEKLIRALVVKSLLDKGIQLPYYIDKQKDTQKNLVHIPEDLQSIEFPGYEYLRDDLFYFTEKIINLIALEKASSSKNEDLISIAETFIEDLVISDEINDQEKIIFIKTAQEYISVLIDKALAKWKLEPTLEQISNTQNPATIALIGLSREVEIKKEAINKEVFIYMRSILSEQISRLLPKNHDDFINLLYSLEINIKNLLNPEYLNNLGDTEDSVDSFMQHVHNICGHISERNNIKTEDLVEIAINLAPKYIIKGYRNN